MAEQFSICLQSTSYGSVIAEFLDRDSRPIFMEDVNFERQALFEVISDIEYPDEIKVENSSIICRWFGKDRFSLRDLLPLIHFEGIEFVLAFEISDDPLSFDEDVEEGWFWIVKEGVFLQVDKNAAIESKGLSLVNDLVGID